MDRLSALDAEFLYLEDGITHMHIAGLSVFEGPPIRAVDLERLLAGKLHLIPRYRQRVRTVPLELGRPVWLDDPHFDLEFHVRHTALPGPGDDATLQRLMGRLMSHPLDRDRPLWEVWVVEGLPDDRWALITKVHHCMVDGISGVDLLGVMLDATPDAPVLDPQPWEPRPEPSGAARVLDAWAGLAGDLADRARGLGDAVRDPLGALRRVGDTGTAIVHLAQHLDTGPDRLSIEGPISPHRAWAHSSVTIDDVRVIRAGLGGTLNDVVLAAVTAGYRQLLLERGDDLDEAVVRSLVPVSVRTPDARGTPDNRVSGVLVELPVAIDDPVARLEAVRGQMDEMKEAHVADAGQELASLADLVPPVVADAGSRLGRRMSRLSPQHPVHTVTTNVPGPQFPLYCLGREMLAYSPYVPIADGLRVGTAILSYNGILAFGVTGDRRSVPEVQVLADTIPRAIAELCEVARSR